MELGQGYTHTVSIVGQLGGRTGGMEEKGHKTRALHVSPLESRSCSIEDEELREVWDCLTAAGNSFFGGWLGLIIRIEMPTACFPTFSKNM